MRNILTAILMTGLSATAFADTAKKPADKPAATATDKKAARINCINHLLSLAPYDEIVRPKIELPARERHPEYTRHPVPVEMIVPEIFP